jgi:Histidine kinase-, DNA gyrase B-, and HSP90-like ATPase/GAF domain
MADELTPLLQTALQWATSAQTPRRMARAIVAASVDRLKASGGWFYRLDLAIGAHVPFVWPEGGGVGVDSKRRIEVPVRVLRVPDGHISSASHFLTVAARGDRAPAVGEGTAIYAFRGESCIGVLLLEGIAPSAVDAGLREELFAVASLLGLVYENEFAFNLLSELQRPLDVNEPDVVFFRQIAKLIKRAARMEYVALREHRGGALRCIALDGFGEDPTLGEWDFEDIDEHEDFAQALRTEETVPVPRLDRKRHAKLLAQPWSKDVRSFVAIPVKVGTEIFGVLSVAARCEFQYSQVELRGFESIANAVGVSIANFRNSRKLSIRVGEYVETAMALTGLEVARSVKHEALNYTTIANTGLHDLWVRLGKPKEDPDVDYVSNALKRLGAALNEITETPSRLTPSEWRQTSLRELWDEACTAVAGRLDEQRIEVRQPSFDAKVYARPQWLRQVFLNLLLNSIDALRDEKKTGRRIELQITPPAQRARQITVSYSDNGSGITPHRLQAPAGTPELPVEQLIFQEGVTSKRGGSGYGLWLVRHILDEHRASIDLTDYRGGVTFALRFPKAEEAETMLKDK